MRLLIDTNIILEILLAQEKANEARGLLAKVESHEFYISDYSLHSIGTILFRRTKPHVFRQFLKDMLIHAGMAVITLPIEDMVSVIEAAKAFKLDFDDAYQYAIADKHMLTIISFDADFDRTERGRRRPAEILRR